MVKEYLNLMRSHKSVRSYSNREVSEQMVEEIISSAQMASTSNFIQAYSVIQIQDDKKREKLAEYSNHQPYVREAPVFLVFITDLYRLGKVVEEVGETSANFSTIESFMLTAVDTSLFAQNVMLAAESMGLGGVYIGGIRNNPDKVADILNLPDYTFPLFGMCLGYPDEKSEKIDQKERLPLSVILHKDTYNREFFEDVKAYDQRIKDYYRERTAGEINDNWSEKMAKQFSKPLRPHLRNSILNKKFSLD